MMLRMQVNKCKAFGVNVVQFGQHILEAKDHATSAPQFKVLMYHRSASASRHKTAATYMNLEQYCIWCIRAASVSEALPSMKEAEATQL